jgi:hypothetical protein
MGKRQRRRLRELGLRKQPQEARTIWLAEAERFRKSLNLVGLQKGTTKEAVKS